MSKDDKILVERLIEESNWHDPTCNELLKEAAVRIKDMTSAQPEIIRCKDCKYKQFENMIWTCKFGLPGGPEFYCGYGAKGEDNGIDQQATSD